MDGLAKHPCCAKQGNTFSQAPRRRLIAGRPGRLRLRLRAHGFGLSLGRLLRRLQQSLAVVVQAGFDGSLLSLWCQSCDFYGAVGLVALNA